MNYNKVNVNVSGPIQPSSTYKTVVLKGNQSFASQVTEPNTKYVVKHNFDLGGESVAMPENCILEFDGGSLNNGTLTGNHTIIYGQFNCLKKDLLIQGNYRHSHVYSNWCEKNNNTSDNVFLQKLFNLCVGENVVSISLDGDMYQINGDDGEDWDSSEINPFDDCGIHIPSNTVCYFNNSIISINPTSYNKYAGLNISGESNIIINDVTIIGEGEYHTGTTGEFGYGVVVLGSKNISLRNVSSNYCWGDGLVIGHYVVDDENVLCENIDVSDCKFSNNRRQGCSILSGTELLFNNTLFVDTGNPLWASPGAGMDIEPDWENWQIVENVYLNGCVFGGYRSLLLADLKTDIARINNININSCIFNGELGILIKTGAYLNIEDSTINGIINTVCGSINIERCTINGQHNFIPVATNQGGDTNISFIDCTFNRPQYFYEGHDSLRMFSMLRLGTLDDENEPVNKVNIKYINSRFIINSAAEVWDTHSPVLVTYCPNYTFDYYGCIFINTVQSAERFNIHFTNVMLNCESSCVNKIVCHRKSGFTDTIRIYGCNFVHFTDTPLLYVINNQAHTSGFQDFTFLNCMILVKNAVIVSIDDGVSPQPIVALYNNVFTGNTKFTETNYRLGNSSLLGAGSKYTGLYKYINSGPYNPTNYNEEGNSFYNTGYRKPVYWDGARLANAEGRALSPNTTITANRPKGIGAQGGILDPSKDLGFCIYDVQIHKPIYADAIANDGTVTWVDATGATV